MFLAFLSLAVLGAVLLITVIALYSRKDLLSSSTGEKSSHRVSGPPDDRSERLEIDHDQRHEETRQGEIPQPAEMDGGREPEKLQPGGRFIPVLERTGALPGVRDSEHLHFTAPAVLYSVESESIPEDIDEKGLSEEIEGRLALTSGHVVVYNDEDSKRFSLASIEQHRIHGSFLIMKRKNVKYKKDIIRIMKDPVEFIYILQALL
jgi:hypothetical protein